ncbi:hypothetical protein WAZ07_22120 [Bacillus sp. FJAT-51639]|uniref:Uncharacterized protein n=1 Tax=Bacillus bruguierae TaxID=3127667 RepID=A0ABU8FME8_9BACI
MWPCIEAVSSYFCHMQGLKQKEKARSGHGVFGIAATYMAEN